MSERAPQWERDNGLPGRHALSSPVPPRSCHSSLIAQNGLLRDCRLPLRRSLPFLPFPSPAPTPGCCGGHPRSAPGGEAPGGRGLRRAASPRPCLEAGNRAQQSPSAETTGKGEPPPGRPRDPAGPTSQRRGAGGAAPRSPARLFAASSRPKATCGVGFTPPPPPPRRVMHIYRNGAEYRDGHAGAFGCDGISPEGKAEQERGSPAVGLRDTPGGEGGGSAKTRGSGRTPPPPPAAPSSPRSPPLLLPQTFQSTGCHRANLPVARASFRGAPRGPLEPRKRTRAKAEYEPMSRSSRPAG